MKYNILVNQLTWKALCPDSDFRHAVVFDIIKMLCNSQSDKMIRTGDGFTWIASSLILSQAPMLKIKTKAGLTPIIESLRAWGMLDIKCEAGGKQFYRLTVYSEGLERSLDDKNIKQVLDSLNGSVSSSKQYRLQNRIYNNKGSKRDKEYKNKKRSAPNGARLSKEKTFAAKKLEESLTNEEFAEYCKKSKQRHVRMIGWLAQQTNASFDTAGEWQQYFQRHVKSAGKAAKFSNEKIFSALKEIKASDYISEFSFETIVKFITNGKNEKQKSNNNHGRMPICDADDFGDKNGLQEW